jgi:hypothetical protein
MNDVLTVEIFKSLIIIDLKKLEAKDLFKLVELHIKDAEIKGKISFKISTHYQLNNSDKIKMINSEHNNMSELEIIGVIMAYILNDTKSKTIKKEKLIIKEIK